MRTPAIDQHRHPSRSALEAFAYDEQGKAGPARAREPQSMAWCVGGGSDGAVLVGGLPVGVLKRLRGWQG
jgi:hypothetical protein